ncbi:MAG: pilus assembly protein PilO [bacterium]|nr:MAG: pilus assembly protein PilO [bacterium]
MNIEKYMKKLREKIPFTRLAAMDIRARWAAVALVPILLLTALFLLLISPKLTEVAGLESELINAKQEVQKKQVLERRLPEFEKEIKTKDYELSLLRRQLPEEKEIPDLIDQVSNLGTQSGLEFITFKPLSETDRDFFAEVPVELKIIGKFHNLLAFFDRISRLPRIVTIKNLDIEKSAAATKAGRGERNLVLASCKAITYRFIESRVDAPLEKTGDKG